MRALDKLLTRELEGEVETRMELEGGHLLQEESLCLD